MLKIYTQTSPRENEHLHNTKIVSRQKTQHSGSLQFKINNSEKNIFIPLYILLSMAYYSMVNCSLIMQ